MLQAQDVVEVIETNRRGVIVNARADEDEYWVEFDMNAATREWFNEAQLRLIPKSESDSGAQMYPDKPLMS